MCNVPAPTCLDSSRAKNYRRMVGARSTLHVARLAGPFMPSRAVATALLIVAASVHAASGQAPPRATITPFVGTDGVRAGSTTRVALTVALPEGLHVQSDQPRDPALIPTVLTIEPPPGVRVTHPIFPHPTDFTLEGQTEPLAVFGHEFVAGAELEIASSVASGEIVIPARLRYQACDDKACFRPITATTGWTLRVVPAGTPIRPTNQDVFTRL